MSVLRHDAGAPGRPDSRAARPLITLAVAFLGLAALVPALALIGGESETAPGRSANPRFGIYAPGTLNELSPSASQRMIDALGLDSEAAFQDWSLALVEEAGAGWVRIDFRYTGWGFYYPDHLLDQLQGSGLTTVGCIRPMNKQTPGDLSRFDAELRRLIEQFPWIRVWQIGNEPDLAWKDLADFARFYLAAEAVVREACPDCRVALAGAAALFPGHDDALADYDLILGALAPAAAGREQPLFDIVDLHFYGYAGVEEEILAAVSAFRDLLTRHGFSPGTTLWVTETATPSGHPTWPPGAPAQSEAQQAGELLRRFTALLWVGAEKVSWARPYENYRYDDRQDSFFDSAGLVYNGLGQEAGQGVAAGTRKPAFHAYRTLAEKTEGFTTVDCLAPGQYRFNFDDGRPALYVLWSNREGAAPVELSGPVTVTDIYGASRQGDGSSLRLGWVPVMVEQQGVPG